VDYSPPRHISESSETESVEDQPGQDRPIRCSKVPFKCCQSIQWDVAGLPDTKIYG
jgi:hypothetical protein